MRVILAVSVAALLSGCGLIQKSLIPPAAPHVTIQADEFSRETQIIGFGLYDNPLMGPFRNWMLRSWVDRQTGTVTHQLYVETHYYDLLPLFDAGSDDETTDLRVTRIDKHVTDCSRGHQDCLYYETDVVDIDDGFLRRRASNGFRVKLYGHSGETSIFEVTPQMIGLQLEAVDKGRGGKAGNPP